VSKKRALPGENLKKSFFSFFSSGYDLDVKKIFMPHNKKYFLFIHKKSFLKKVDTKPKTFLQNFLGVTGRKVLTYKVFF